MARQINEKCLECSKISFKGKNVALRPKCYKDGRCRKKRAYYRKLEHYRAKQRERHRYLRYKGNRCVLCKVEDNLEVHHIIPQSRGGTDEWTNLLTLCHKCHKQITTYYKVIGWI